MKLPMWEMNKLCDFLYNHLVAMLSPQEYIIHVIPALV